MSQQLVENSYFVDLTNCDKEPIHIPGSIQPHGILLALTAPELRIVRVSENISDFFGVRAEDLLEKPLEELLNREDVEKIEKCLGEDFESVNPLKLSLEKSEKLHHFNGIVHRQDRTVILELEPIEESKEVDFFSFYRSIEANYLRIYRSGNVAGVSS